MDQSGQDRPRLWYDRGYLPHYDGIRLTQFITYRLHDSLPAKVIEHYKRELESKLISEIEHHRLVDKYLDGGFGDGHLRKPEIAEMVIENLLRFDGEKYKLFSWVIMPNHAHLLLQPAAGISLASIMHSLKSYTAHQANFILGRKGAFWSKEYFDRFIRDAEHFQTVRRYIENNPVKAGLCVQASDWRYGSAGYRRE